MSTYNCYRRKRQPFHFVKKCYQGHEKKSEIQDVVSSGGGRRGAGSLGGVANAALVSNFSEADTGIRYYAS